MSVLTERLFQESEADIEEFLLQSLEAEEGVSGHTKCFLLYLRMNAYLHPYNIISLFLSCLEL